MLISISQLGIKNNNKSTRKNKMATEAENSIPPVEVLPAASKRKPTAKKPAEVGTTADDEPKQTRRGRPKKVVETIEESPEVGLEEKPKRGRSKKTTEVIEESEADGISKNASENPVEVAKEADKPKRGKAKKEETENTVLNNSVQEKQAEGPMAASHVAQCFMNVVSPSDVKVETERLRKLFKAEPESTWADFSVCVNRVLGEYKATTQLLLCCDLIAHFILTLSSETQNTFVTRLTNSLKAKDKAVRLRSAHLLRLWLKAQTELAEDVHAKLVESMLETIYDKNPLVRQEVFACLEFLQDPENAEDKVIKALVLAAQHDPVAKVRKTALRVVAPSEVSIEAFICKTKDEADEVRIACWKELEERFKMQWFPSDSLNEMFEQGLSDFSDPCRIQSGKCLLRWFAERKNDLFTFIEMFDLTQGVETETVMFKVLDVIRPKISFDKTISPATCLTRAASLYLRYLCERQLAEDLEHVTATSFMESLIQVFQVMRNSQDDHYDSGSFISRQLVLGCCALNMTHDSFGRSAVTRTLSEALLVESFPASLVEPITKCVKMCFHDDSQFILEITTNVVSFLSELQPLDQCRADILKAEQLIEDLTRQRDYASLPALVTEIESLKLKEKELMSSDGTTSQEAKPEFNRLVRSTALVCAILRLLPRTKDASLLHDLLETACVPAVQSPEAEARSYGVEALGLLALRDVAIAKSHGMLLSRTFFENEREDPEVRLKALQVMFDLVIQFGKQVCETESEFDSLIKYFMSFLEVDREDEIRTLAAIGLTKMLFLERVSYPGLVQCLLIVAFHPTTEANAKLKQALLTFFAEYKRSDVVLEAAEPLLDAILDPAPDSMCEDLPLDKVVERLAFLLSGESAVVRFGLILIRKIANLIAADDMGAKCKILSRTLCGLALASKHEDAQFEMLKYHLKAAVESGCFETFDKVSAKSLEKIVTSMIKVETKSNLTEIEIKAIQDIFPPAKSMGESSKSRRNARGKTTRGDAGEGEEDDDETDADEA